MLSLKLKGKSPATRKGDKKLSGGLAFKNALRDVCNLRHKVNKSVLYAPASSNESRLRSVSSAYHSIWNLPSDKSQALELRDMLSL